VKIQDALHKIVERQDLTENEMVSVMTQIMQGESSPTLLAAFLTALKMKGECVAEIVGAAKVMREKAEKLEISADKIVDTCGTGGDGGSTFNISTASAFVVAGAGITVAKHGNRAVSSKCGSADVLKSLGVNIDAEKSVVEKCINDIGIGFLFAPKMHGAMKHAMGVRKELGFRTIFNLLGPLTNPAGAHAQVIGVFDARWVTPLAEVLRDLGSSHAYVVHGEDGLDEITLTNNTKIAHLSNGHVEEKNIHPEEFSLPVCKLQDLKGGSPDENAGIIRQILAGQSGPKMDIVLINAAAAIHASDKSSSLQDGLDLARESIRSGAAQQKLDDLCRVTQS
jgi:anthranilate phosphoribosyltransferase